MHMHTVRLQRTPLYASALMIVHLHAELRTHMQGRLVMFFAISCQSLGTTHCTIDIAMCRLYKLEHHRHMLNARANPM